MTGKYSNINDHQVNRATSGSHEANVLAPTLFGLGKNKATHIKVVWPDKERTTQEFKINEYANGILIISKQDGIMHWQEVNAI